MRRYILVDLDDTVAASWRREHLIQESWDAFHADLVNDEPILDTVNLMRCLALEQPLDVIAITARPEKWRRITVDWLVHHCVPVSEVLMRPDDDFRKSPDVKIDLALRRFGNETAVRDQVALVIDDREDVCKAFAGLGVTVLQIYARRQPAPDGEPANA